MQNSAMQRFVITWQGWGRETRAGPAEGGAELGSGPCPGLKPEAGSQQPERVVPAEPGPTSRSSGGGSGQA